MSKEIIISICLSFLILEFVIWFITDPRTYPERLKDSLNPKRLQVYIKASLFLMLYLVVSLNLSWQSSLKDNTYITVGLIVYILGMFFAVWAKLTMNKNWGLPAQHDNKRQNELVTSGPFAYTRNPIYVGNLLLAIGFSIALRSYSLFLIPVIYYAIYKTVLVEEKLLHKKFGEQYEAYTRKVPRFI